MEIPFSQNRITTTREQSKLRFVRAIRYSWKRSCSTTNCPDDKRVPRDLTRKSNHSFDSGILAHPAEVSEPLPVYPSP